MRRDHRAAADLFYHRVTADFFSSLGCHFGGIEDQERGTIFFWKRKANIDSDFGEAFLVFS